MLEKPCASSHAEAASGGWLHSSVKRASDARVTVEDGPRARMMWDGRMKGVQCFMVEEATSAIDHGYNIGERKCEAEGGMLGGCVRDGRLG